jgi:hypothetical protein
MALVLATFVSAQTSQSDTPQCSGWLDTDLAASAGLDQPLPFDVTLKPTDPKTTISQILLVFDHIDGYKIDSAAGEDAYTGVTLQPKAPKKFQLALTKGNPGLIRVRATSPDWDPHCPVLDQTVDTGFDSLVHIASDNPSFLTQEEIASNKGGVPAPIPAGKPQDFVVQFLDHDGQPFNVRAPVTLVFVGFNGTQLSQDGASWTDKPLPITIGKGHKFDRVFLRASSWDHGRGVIDVIAKKDSGKGELAKYSLDYTVDYAWWIYLLATIGGALAYTIIETLVASNKDVRKFWLNLIADYASKLWIALLTGGVAFLLRGVNILGALKFESSTIEGHVALGFLFCIVGLEAVFKKVVELVNRT